MMKKIGFFLIVFTQFLYSQNQGNKGKFYAFWGWNRAQYSNSDITFKGNDYNFTLDNVKAKDKQTPFSVNKYLNPLNMTIPQTNYGFGYFVNDHYHVTLAVDHMKYVMVQNQEVNINGAIGTSHTPYNGTYVDDQITLSKDFLTFEHTDGLNYAHVALNRFDDINKLLHLHSENITVALTEGIGVGVLYPKTNTKLMGNQRYDEFHVSGYGVSLQSAVDVTFLKHFYIQAGLRAGFIDMPDIRTTMYKVDRASQHFTYLQENILIGGRFKL